MGEYEPRDSRNVTLKQERAPGEPPRTGPREQETRQPSSQETELEGDGRGDEPEQMLSAEQRRQQAEQREDSMQRDTDELNAAAADRLDQNGT